MTLNKPSGNMYHWAWTWNPIGGKCPHQCLFCYVDRLSKRGFLKKYEGAPFLDEKTLKDKLVVPKGYVVFAGSCSDIFASGISRLWITKILAHIAEYPNTPVLLQTKNPARFRWYEIPPNCILGTTIETNKIHNYSNAPQPAERFKAMFYLKKWPHKTMVSIEPIMDFDLPKMLSWIEVLKPSLVSIGADSGHNNLPEPSPEKLKQLLWQLEMMTDVRLKKNLGRLLK